MQWTAAVVGVCCYVWSPAVFADPVSTRLPGPHEERRELFGGGALDSPPTKRWLNGADADGETLYGPAAATADAGEEAESVKSTDAGATEDEAAAAAAEEADSPDAADADVSEDKDGDAVEEEEEEGQEGEADREHEEGEKADLEEHEEDEEADREEHEEGEEVDPQEHEEGEEADPGQHEEGEEAGEHELHHEKVTNVSFTISAMLLMFFVLNMCTLYMVNFRDENVRSYIFKMLESMISIFLAVIINDAIFGFLLDQVLAGRGCRGFHLDPGLWLHTATGLVMFTVLGFMINMCAFRWREFPIWLYGSRRLLGHISAFAGIMTFSHLQRALIAPNLGTFIACLILLVYMFVWSRWRRGRREVNSSADTNGENSVEAPMLDDPCQGVGQWQVELHSEFKDYPQDINRLIVLGAMNGEKQIRFFMHGTDYVVMLNDDFTTGIQRGHHTRTKERSVQLRKTRLESHESEWKEDVFESEIDAFCLTLSYLIVVTLRWRITGSLPELHEHGDSGASADQLRRLAKAALVFLFLVIAVTFTRSWNGGMREETQIVLGAMQTLFAMCMSWCLLFIGSWVVQIYTSATAEMSMVVNAFFLTFVAVAIVVLLDRFADRLRPAATGEGEPKGHAEAEATATPGGSRGSVFEDDKALLDRFQNLSSSLQDKDVHEKALRKLIECAGILVGIVWEKALAAATGCVEGYVSTTRQHSVITKLGIAFGLSLLVMPAYLKYIVPVARRDDEIWARLMRTEALQSVMEKLKKSDFKTANKLLTRLDNRKGEKTLLQDVDEDIRSLMYVKCRLIQMKQSQSTGASGASELMLTPRKEGMRRRELAAELAPELLP